MSVFRRLALLLALWLPASTPAEERLSKPQLRQIRVGQYYVRSVGASLESFRALADEVKRPKNNRPAERYEQALRDLAILGKRLEDAQRSLSGLEPLPAVSQLRRRIESQRAEVNAYGRALKEALRHREERRVGRDKFPELENDLARLSCLKAAYAQLIWFEGDPEQVEALWPTLTTNQALGDRLVAKYQPLIDKGLKAGERVRQARYQLERAIEGFKKRSETFVEQAPGKVSELLAEVKGLLVRVREEGNYSLLVYSVRPRMKSARLLLRSLSANPEKLPDIHELLKQYTQVRDELNRLGREKDQEISASIESPSDVYSGEDHGKLRQLAEQAFAEQRPQDATLAIRFSSSVWRVTEDWRYDPGLESWGKVKVSRLDIIILVAADTERVDLVNASLVKANNNISLEIHDDDYLIQMLPANLDPELKASFDRLVSAGVVRKAEPLPEEAPHPERPAVEEHQDPFAPAPEAPGEVEPSDT